MTECRMIVLRSHLKMDLKAYEIGEILGSGNFGIVHEGKCRSSGRVVALKFIPRAKVRQ
jgi:serine/threonine protein kinase